MKFNFRKFEPNFKAIIEQFLNNQITVQQFCSDFIAYWIIYVNEQHESETPWEKQHLMEIHEQFEKGKITKEEYLQKSRAITGLDDENYRNFSKMVDGIHGACFVYNPEPDREIWELTEEQLRAEVIDLVNQYN